MAQRRHLVITGTGRAGTSFLVTLFTRLGFDTGFTEEQLALDEIARAGLEWDLRKRSPYVVKAPTLSLYIDQVLARDDIVIEHAIIPMRDLEAAAASRVHVSALATDGQFDKRVKGGLWETKRPEKQFAILARTFHSLVLALATADVPMTFLRYPRFMRDSHYLYAKLSAFMRGITFETFDAVFQKTMRPDWVHKFTDADD